MENAVQCDPMPGGITYMQQASGHACNVDTKCSREEHGRATRQWVGRGDSTLTLIQMLRLLSSKGQGRNDF